MSGFRGELYRRTVRCPGCGRVQEIWPYKRKVRPEGHVKTMFCPFCRRDMDMVEVREWSR